MYEIKLKYFYNQWLHSFILGCYFQSQKYCSFLIKNGADVNAKDNNRQETTLHEMAHQGKLEIAKILLEPFASGAL